MFRQVRSFLRNRPADTAIEPTLVALERLINQMEAHAEAQEVHTRLSRARTSSVREVARRLRRHVMRPVALVGNSLFPSDDAEMQAARRALTMPTSTDYASLVVAAQGMAAVVAEHEARFIQAGIPKPTLDRLRTDAEALQQSITGRGNTRGKRVAATRGARVEAKRGLQLVALLDALLEPALQGDPVQLAEWRSATQAARVAVTPATPAEPTTPVPANAEVRAAA